MIDSAPWAAREGHTSVIDATGAIYVLGGFNGGLFYHDVWVSTDKGADRTLGGAYVYVHFSVCACERGYTYICIQI